MILHFIYMLNMFSYKSEKAKAHTFSQRRDSLGLRPEPDVCESVWELDTLTFVRPVQLF